MFIDLFFDRFSGGAMKKRQYERTGFGGSMIIGKQDKNGEDGRSG
jgi:hypothetical protein